MAGATASAAGASQLVLTRFPPPASKSASEAAVAAAVDAAVAAAAAPAPAVAALASEESAGSAEEAGAAALAASLGTFGSGAAPGEAECAAPSGNGLTPSVAAAAAAAATNTVAAALAVLGERAGSEALGVENAYAMHTGNARETTPALRVVAARDMQLLALARRGVDGLAADEQQGVRELGSDAQGTGRGSRESADLGPAVKKWRGSLDWDSEASEQRGAALGKAHGPGRKPEIRRSVCSDRAEPCHSELEQASSIDLPGGAAQPMAEQRRQEPYPEPFPSRGLPVAAGSHTRERKLHGGHRGAQDREVKTGTSDFGISEFDGDECGSNRRGERGVHRRQVAALSKEDEDSFWNGSWGEPESGETASILPSLEEQAGMAGAGEAV